MRKSTPKYYVKIAGWVAPYWWRIESKNGKIMATSETYFSKANCRRAALKFAKEFNLEVHGD